MLLISVTLFFCVLEFQEFEDQVSNCKTHCCNHMRCALSRFPLVFVNIKMSLVHFTYCSRAQWPHEDPCIPDDSLLNMGNHVGDLSFKIWKNLQTHVKHCEYISLGDPRYSHCLCVCVTVLQHCRKQLSV